MFTVNKLHLVLSLQIAVSCSQSIDDSESLDDSNNDFACNCTELTTKFDEKLNQANLVLDEFDERWKNFSTISKIETLTSTIGELDNKLTKLFSNFRHNARKNGIRMDAEFENLSLEETKTHLLEKIQKMEKDVESIRNSFVRTYDYRFALGMILNWDNKARQLKSINLDQLVQCQFTKLDLQDSDCRVARAIAKYQQLSMQVSKINSIVDRRPMSKLMRTCRICEMVINDFLDQLSRVQQYIESVRFTVRNFQESENMETQTAKLKVELNSRQTEMNSKQESTNVQWYDVD